LRLAVTAAFFEETGVPQRRPADKDQIADIVARYRRLIRGYLERLAVPGAVDIEKLAIESGIQDSGSELPRTLLPYYLCILR
jgi:hypothetical protein